MSTLLWPRIVPFFESPQKRASADQPTAVCILAPAVNFRCFGTGHARTTFLQPSRRLSKRMHAVLDGNLHIPLLISHQILRVFFFSTKPLLLPAVDFGWDDNDAGQVAGPLRPRPRRYKKPI